MDHTIETTDATHADVEPVGDDQSDQAVYKFVSDRTRPSRRSR